MSLDGRRSVSPFGISNVSSFVTTLVSRVLLELLRYNKQQDLKIELGLSSFAGSATLQK